MRSMLATAEIAFAHRKVTLFGKAIEKRHIVVL